MKKFKAGKYYIGDPCYLFDDLWIQILEDNKYFQNPKKEQLINGLQVHVDSTAYGDGTYEDQYGNDYPVDAGIIGILPIELLSYDKGMSVEEVENLGYGHIVDFPTDFNVDSMAGEFVFGHIVIDTKGYEDDGDNDFYDDEDEY